MGCGFFIKELERNNHYLREPRCNPIKRVIGEYIVKSIQQKIYKNGNEDNNAI